MFCDHNIYVSSTCCKGVWKADVYNFKMPNVEFPRSRARFITVVCLEGK